MNSKKISSVYQTMKLQGKDCKKDKPTSEGGQSIKDTDANVNAARKVAFVRGMKKIHNMGNRKPSLFRLFNCNFFATKRQR